MNFLDYYVSQKSYGPMGILHHHKTLEWFDEHFEKVLKNSVPHWKEWHQQILDEYETSQICPLFYEDLKKDIIKTIKPCINFLGFDLNFELEDCIIKNEKGNNHRLKRPQHEIDYILSLIPVQAMKNYKKIKNEIFDHFSQYH